jgi:hypothetical protein
MMKGIDFAFDAFGQWSEHDRSMMQWRMKVRIEWRPSMASPLKIGGRLATFSPFLHSPPLSPSLARPPHLWDRMEGLWPHGLAAQPPSLTGGHPLAPLLNGCKGRLLLHPTSSQATSNLLNPSPSS